LVIDGKRNLSTESIEKVSLALQLSKEEGEYFRYLVLLNQATTHEEKQHYTELIMSLGAFRKVQPLKAAQYRYYAHWYLIPVRELVGLSHFKEDPAWIARMLCPPITATEAKTALETLLELQLLRRNQNGRLVQSDATINTEDEVTSSLITRFHQEMIQKGSESITRFKPQQREVSCVTVGFSKERAQKAKELIQRFRLELLALASEDPAPERVYQIGFQFFPLSEDPTREDDS
jgi:uncharacterized protein (TIGR02147 family)